MPIQAASNMERIEQHACFGGLQEVWKHSSSTLRCDMKFGVYLPHIAVQGEYCPVLYWLSGLTCNEQNFITKAGAQRFADANGLIVVTPDTSPRGDDIPDDSAYDLGQGASFYLNATQPPWSTHYRMADYIVDELPALIEQHFPANDKRSLSGHSMGGHGALTLALRNPTRYSSVSAFSPIVAPSQVPWGLKAFNAYLGEEQSTWQQYDAVALILAKQASTPFLPILVDQGQADEFLATQLKTHVLREACAQMGYPLELHLRPGFDHSYYFIASLIDAHFKFHATYLK